MYVPKSKFSIPSDAPEYMHSCMTQLRNELTAISRTVVGQSTTVVVAGMGSTPGTNGSLSSSSGTSTSNVKSGVKFVTAATATFVPFPTVNGNPVFTVVPTVICAVSGVDNSFGFYNSSKLTVSTTGFIIPADEILVSGTITYLAHSN